MKINIFYLKIGLRAFQYFQYVNQEISTKTKKNISIDREFYALSDCNYRLFQSRSSLEKSDISENSYKKTKKVK